MILTGKVTSGLGEAKFWIKKAEKAFENKIGIKLYHGTLNLELEQDYILKDNILVLHKEEYGGSQEVYVQQCKIFKHLAYILRTEKNSTKDGDHPLNLIEIISDINLREKYNLKDGDLVDIEI